MSDLTAAGAAGGESVQEWLRRRGMRVKVARTPATERPVVLVMRRIDGFFGGLFRRRKGWAGQVPPESERGRPVVPAARRIIGAA